MSGKLHVGLMVLICLVPVLLVLALPALGVNIGGGAWFLLILLCPLAHLLMMGAAGIQMGTCFVMAEECNAHPKFKEVFKRAKAKDATATPQFDSRLPVIPVIGDGNYKLQPVHIDDIAAGVAGTIDDDRAINGTFEIGGAEVMTFNRLLDEIGAALGKKKVNKIHQPILLMKALAGIFGRFAWYPVTVEQITMLLEGNFTSDRSFFDLYKIAPRSFKESIMRLLGNRAPDKDG